VTNLIEVSNQDTLFSEEKTVSWFETNDEDTITVTEEVLTIVSEAVQGPMGVQGPQGPQGQTGLVALSDPFVDAGYF
jgi:hypothetical protein